MPGDEKQDRAESVERQMRGDKAPTDTNRESQVGPTGGGGGEMAPEGVGESVSRRGEDVGEGGQEAGRTDTGTDDTAAERPTGTSSSRDQTGVDPQEG